MVFQPIFSLPRKQQKLSKPESRKNRQIIGVLIPNLDIGLTQTNTPHWIYNRDLFFKFADPIPHLIGIENSSAELLDEKRVREYLQSVAPIPYATGFTFKSKISEFAQEHGFTIDEYQYILTV